MSEAFFSCQQGDKLLSEHYDILEGLWGELTSYHPLTTDITILERQYEELLVVRFLSSLNPIYESSKNGILTKKELPNINEAFARLKRLPSTHGNQDPYALASFGGRGQGQTTGRG